MMGTPDPSINSLFEGLIRGKGPLEDSLNADDTDNVTLGTSVASDCLKEAAKELVQTHSYHLMKSGGIPKGHPAHIAHLRKIQQQLQRLRNQKPGKEPEYRETETEDDLLMSNSQMVDLCNEMCEELLASKLSLYVCPECHDAMDQEDRGLPHTTQEESVRWPLEYADDDVRQNVVNFIEELGYRTEQAVNLEQPQTHARMDEYTLIHADETPYTHTHTRTHAYSSRPHLDSNEDAYTSPPDSPPPAKLLDDGRNSRTNSPTGMEVCANANARLGACVSTNSQPQPQPSPIMTSFACTGQNSPPNIMTSTNRKPIPNNIPIPQQESTSTQTPSPAPVSVVTTMPTPAQVPTSAGWDTLIGDNDNGLPTPCAKFPINTNFSAASPVSTSSSKITPTTTPPILSTSRHTRLTKRGSRPMRSNHTQTPTNSNATAISLNTNISTTKNTLQQSMQSSQTTTAGGVCGCDVCTKRLREYETQLELYRTYVGIVSSSDTCRGKLQEVVDGVGFRSSAGSDKLDSAIASMPFPQHAAWDAESAKLWNELRSFVRAIYRQGLYIAYGTSTSAMDRRHTPNKNAVPVNMQTMTRMIDIMCFLSTTDADLLFKFLMREVREWLEESRDALAEIIHQHPDTKHKNTSPNSSSHGIGSKHGSNYKHESDSGIPMRFGAADDLQRHGTSPPLPSKHASGDWKQSSDTKGAYNVNIAAAAQFFGVLLNLFTSISIAMSDFAPLFLPLQDALLQDCFDTSWVDLNKCLFAEFVFYDDFVQYNLPPFIAYLKANGTKSSNSSPTQSTTSSRSASKEDARLHDQVLSEYLTFESEMRLLHAQWNKTRRLLERYDFDNIRDAIAQRHHAAEAVMSGNGDVSQLPPIYSPVMAELWMLRPPTEEEDIDDLDVGAGERVDVDVGYVHSEGECGYRDSDGVRTETHSRVLTQSRTHTHSNSNSHPHGRESHPHSLSGKRTHAEAHFGSRHHDEGRDCLSDDSGPPPLVPISALRRDKGNSSYLHPLQTTHSHSHSRPHTHIHSNRHEYAYGEEDHVHDELDHLHEHTHEDEDEGEEYYDSDDPPKAVGLDDCSCPTCIGQTNTAMGIASDDSARVGENASEIEKDMSEREEAAVGSARGGPCSCAECAKHRRAPPMDAKGNCTHCLRPVVVRNDRGGGGATGDLEYDEYEHIDDDRSVCMCCSDDELRDDGGDGYEDMDTAYQPPLPPPLPPPRLNHDPSIARDKLKKKLLLKQGRHAKAQEKAYKQALATANTVSDFNGRLIQQNKIGGKVNVDVDDILQFIEGGKSSRSEAVQASRKEKRAKKKEKLKREKQMGKVNNSATSVSETTGPTVDANVDKVTRAPPPLIPINKVSPNVDAKSVGPSEKEVRAVKTVDVETSVHIDEKAKKQHTLTPTQLNKDLTQVSVNKEKNAPASSGKKSFAPNSSVNVAVNNSTSDSRSNEVKKKEKGEEKKIMNKTKHTALLNALENDKYNEDEDDDVVAEFKRLMNIAHADAPAGRKKVAVKLDMGTLGLAKRYNATKKT
eukprot:CFRG7894T1